MPKILKSPTKVAAFSNVTQSWQMAVFELSKMQGAAPMMGTSLPFVLIPHASLRRLFLNVNEKVLICGCAGFTSGDTLDQSILLSEVKDDSVSFERILVGRVWPTTMAVGAVAMLEESSRNRLGLQYGTQIFVTRLDSLVSHLDIASHVYLSPQNQTDLSSKAGKTAGIVLAHQLSEFHRQPIVSTRSNMSSRRGGLLETGLHG